MNFVNWILFIAAGILGWVVVDLAYVDGYEFKGGYIKNFTKFLKPKNWQWLTIYILATACAAFVAVNLFAYDLTLINIVIFLTFLVLLHAALVDLICMQIVINPLIICLAVWLLINLGMLVVGGWEYQLQGFTPKDNLTAAAFGAALFLSIIKLTKGKGMGEGDLFVFVVMALVLGIGKLLVAFYVMIFAGCIYGLIKGLIIRKIKGVRLPFVPFMVLGFVVALIYGQLIIDLYLRIAVFQNYP
jgi:prepilin signal peptidase PulO-like enzyme (type II secretory pathway)